LSDPNKKATVLSPAKSGAKSGTSVKEYEGVKELTKATLFKKW